MTSRPPRMPDTLPVSRRWLRRPHGEHGKVKPMVLLWALGIPLPIVLIIALVRGCG